MSSDGFSTKSRLITALTLLSIISPVALQESYPKKGLLIQTYPYKTSTQAIPGELLNHTNKPFKAPNSNHTITEHLYTIKMDQSNTAHKSDVAELTLFKLSNTVFKPLEPDSKAKDIILISTAVTTMVLSSCFLMFITWFCCYLMCRDRMEAKRSERFNEFKLNETVSSKMSKQGCGELKVKNEVESVKEINVPGVEDYTSLNEHQMIQSDFQGKVNQGFTDETQDILANLPKLTSSQIENDFKVYTLERRRRYGTSFSSSTNSIYQWTTRSTRFVRDPSHLGTYSKNFQRYKKKNQNEKIAKKSRVSKSSSGSHVQKAAMHDASSDRTWMI